MTPAIIPNIDQLTREILHFEDLATRCTEDAVKFKLEIGKRLIRAKAALPHGEFLPWAERHFHWSRRHVANHMALARNEQRVSQLPEDASLRMALEAITPRKPVASARPEHTRLAVTLDSGDEAILELRSGDLAELCELFEAREIPFRPLQTAKAA